MQVGGWGWNGRRYRSSGRKDERDGGRTDERECEGRRKGGRTKGRTGRAPGESVQRVLLDYHFSTQQIYLTVIMTDVSWLIYK